MAAPELLPYLQFSQMTSMSLCPCVVLQGPTQPSSSSVYQLSSHLRSWQTH